MNKSVLGSVRGFARASLLCLPALLLAACGGGGGGGGGDDGGSGGSTVSGVVITSTNAKAVAADAVEVAADGQYAEGGTSLVLGAQVDAGSGGGALRLTDVGRRFMTMTPAGGSLATGVAVDQTVNCDSGTLRLTGEVSDSGFTAGNTVNYTASSCKLGTMTMNGSMTIKLLSGSISQASTFPFSLSMQVTVADFSIADGTGTETINGDMKIDISASSATSETLSVSGSSLATSGGHTAVLKDYTVSMSVSGSVTTQSVSGTVETTNSRIGGTVSYTISTVTAITYTDSGSVTGGAIKVSGAGSTLLVTVTGADSFKLEIDANGDGVYETTQTTTRSELAALL